MGTQNDNVLHMDQGNELVALTNNHLMSIVEVTDPEQNQLGNLEDQVEGESKLNSARYKFILQFFFWTPCLASSILSSRSFTILWR